MNLKDKSAVHASRASTIDDKLPLPLPFPQLYLGQLTSSSVLPSSLCLS